ncbi:MAG: phage antirepressor KilAC domain-containing protein [Gordonia sp. (in: high G+C Gram-positive bacteria)]|uniref:phage antirepressor KilAC domain-containing protein n=1 Tax=Gordonia sp. (in: high G+C Gram-positive bacteria) TaxID=84139 RepID=UPI003C766AC9
MQDLTLPAARTERDQLAGRTDVLDKVGVLRTLPDDMNLTTPMVAEFYQIDADLVRYHVKSNRDEFDSDGYRVVVRAAFESEFGSLSNLDPKVRQVALFPRRAALRLGMLLRDSEVARRVRDMLLDVERADATVHFLIPKTLPEALRAYATEVEAHELTTARAEAAETSNRVLVSRIEKDAPLVAKAEAHTASITWIHRQDFAREVKQWGVGRGIVISHEHVYELLRRKKMMIAGDRSDRNQASSHAITAGWARNTKGTAENGHEYVTTRISPRGQDVAWKWITAHVEQFGTLAPQEVSA